MKKIQDIKRYELEITSLCNAACPACVRTKVPGNYDLLSLSINDIKRIFPSESYMNDRQFMLCGTLGDPVVNKDCYEITKYLVSNGAYVMLNTNGSLGTIEWWEKMGKLSSDTQRVSMWFCVDGCEETNYIYRVNTNFDIIRRSMEAYMQGGNGRADGSWVYTLFDHNEKEIEKARAMASRLGLKFAIRKGVDNSLFNWQSTVKKRNKETKEVIIETNIVKTSEKNAHSKLEQVRELVNFNKSQSPKMNTELTEKIVKSIKCKLIHEGELFIASDQTLWPCCFLWSTKITVPEKANGYFKDYDPNWNSLLHHSIEEILQHPWFDVILEQSWDPTHPMHIPKCIESCAYNQAHQHEITYVNTK